MYSTKKVGLHSKHPAIKCWLYVNVIHMYMFFYPFHSLDTATKQNTSRNLIPPTHIVHGVNYDINSPI